jgi:transcriptional regulator with XRE-family HTH domain
MKRDTAVEFARVLAQLRNKARLTRYALAQESQVDPGYLARLERAEKRRPSRRVVLRLGQALLDNSGDITLEDVDRLLESAGHGPLRRIRISILPRK